MDPVGALLVLLGFAMIVFRRRIGLSGSQQRDRLRRFVPLPSDRTYMTMTFVLGWCALIGGIVTIVITFLE
jgi:hypothetical protein